MLTLSVLPSLSSCSPERAKECEALTAAVSPLSDGEPSAEQASRVKQAVESVNLQDEPLREFAGKLRVTLDVLSNTLALKASPSPPDGTDDVIRTRIKEAQAVRADIAHYCSQ
jgi:hypothetical protein